MFDELLEKLKNEDLEEIGTCKDESLIEDIFGSISEFARQVELHGDNFIYRGVKVTYDEETDIHTFYG